jgi:hypothetical protein
MRIAWLLFALVAADAAWANPDTSTVRYSGIDASTLRVFAVGTVGVATVTGHGLPIQVGDLHGGHGTGFAVDPELVITANHVIEGARHVVIRLPGEGGFLPARVVYANRNQDVAVLHVDAKLTPIHLNPAALRVRQAVYAVGYPLDPSRTQAQSAKGIISGQLEDSRLQLDMSLNPGNSGGPLVDEHDTVVGMVVARGEVEHGVVGIGMAVPVAQLDAAVAEARRSVAAGEVPASSQHEMMSAEVVDALIRQGTLPSRDKNEDLKTHLERGDLEQEVDKLTARLDDADLLVFVAGAMWNASLALRYGGVRAVGERKLTEGQAQQLGGSLATAAVRLAKRAVDLDASVGARSGFVQVAVAAPTEVGVHSGDVVAGYRIEPMSAPAAQTRWFVAASILQRQNRYATGGWGGGVELAMRRSYGSMLFGLGASAGVALLDGMEGAGLSHAFFALEVGTGREVALGSRQLQIYVGLAPSYYVAQASAGTTTTSESAFVFDHLRAAASIDVSRIHITSGARMIGSTFWLEPIGVGFLF